MQKEELKIMSEGTPNPNALKFVLNRTILENRSANFANKEKAEQSPLAKRLFEISGVLEIFIGRDFITVTKDYSALWEALYNDVLEAISTHVESGLPVLNSQIVDDSGSSDDPLINKIKSVLDSQIRPALMGDGGDVAFISFEEGILRLHLQGACSSCPSSTMTLKHGIEQMMQREIPEIKEVISI